MDSHVYSELPTSKTRQTHKRYPPADSHIKIIPIYAPCMEYIYMHIYIYKDSIHSFLSTSKNTFVIILNNSETISIPRMFSYQQKRGAPTTKTPRLSEGKRLPPYTSYPPRQVEESKTQYTHITFSLTPRVCQAPFRAPFPKSKNRNQHKAQRKRRVLHVPPIFSINRERSSILSLPRR